MGRTTKGDRALFNAQLDRWIEQNTLDLYDMWNWERGRESIRVNTRTKLNPELQWCYRQTICAVAPPTDDDPKACEGYRILDDADLLLITRELGIA